LLIGHDFRRFSPCAASPVRHARLRGHDASFFLRQKPTPEREGGDGRCSASRASETSSSTPMVPRVRKNQRVLLMGRFACCGSVPQATSSQNMSFACQHEWAPAYDLFFGTRTVVARVVVLPEASAHVTAIVYTRPLPVPTRSARSCRWRASLTSQSGAVSPGPVPSTGSLL